MPVIVWRGGETPSRGRAGQAEQAGVPSPAAGAVKKSSMARELWRSVLSGTGERWSISTDSGRISRQSPLNDEDTGAVSGRRNDPLRTSIPENMHTRTKTQSGGSLNTKNRQQQARCCPATALSVRGC